MIKEWLGVALGVSSCGISLVFRGVFWARSVSISGVEALFMRNDCRPHAVSSPVLAPLLG